MGSKSVERDCLNSVRRSLSRDVLSKKIKTFLLGEIAEGESPDFIIGTTGVEHFLVDMFFTTKKKSAMSLERKNSGKIAKAIDNYHQSPTKLDEDLENGTAIQFLEIIINSQLNGINDFSCQRFCDNFCKVFDMHYNKIDEYKSKCERIVFLIEIPFIPSDINGFVIKNKGKVQAQCFASIPLPRRIIHRIFSSIGLDYVIILLRPMNPTGKKKENVVFCFDVKEKTSNVSNGIICDDFDYALKFPNNDVVKLHLTKDDEDEQT